MTWDRPSDLANGATLLQMIGEFHVHLPHGYSTPTVEETLREGLIFALNTLVLLAAHGNVERLRANGALATSEGSSHADRRELAGTNSLGHTLSTLLHHLADSLRRHSDTAPLAARNLDKLVQKNLIILVNLVVPL